MAFNAGNKPARRLMPATRVAFNAGNKPARRLTPATRVIV